MVDEHGPFWAKFLYVKGFLCRITYFMWILLPHKYVSAIKHSENWGQLANWNEHLGMLILGEILKSTGYSVSDQHILKTFNLKYDNWFCQICEYLNNLFWNLKLPNLCFEFQNKLL